jgi:3-oxoacyl-[acyl-carrier-protein] synthase II
MRQRVVITGMGAICSAGANCKEFAEAVLRGTPSFSPIQRPHLSHFRASHAGIIKEFDGQTHVADPCVRKLDRFVHLAAAAGREALLQAGIVPEKLSRKMGLVFATCSGPMQSIERHYARVLSGDLSITKEELFALRYYCGAKALAHCFGIGGPSATVVTACSASTAAIGFAADLIRLGILDVALAGGSDTFSETTLAGFDGLKATCEGTCAPFSKPVGLNLGEGAGFCVLESLTHAQSRAAEIFAEVMGFGLSNDAYHCTAPDPSGAGQALSMERALRDAGISPSSIAYINAHGTGTEANDKAETKAIRKVFGERAAATPVSSTKSIIGHCLGAAGSLESVAGIMAMARGYYPPTANFSERRDGCTLDYVPTAGRRVERDGPMLKNNFAFGGNNASIVINPRLDPAYSPPQNGADDAVLITGIGIVSPAGLGHEHLIDAVSSGKDALTTVTCSGVPPVRLGMVPAFDMATVDRRVDVRNMDRSSRYATAAARLALHHAGSPDRLPGRGDVGLFLHLSAGPSWAESEHIRSLLSKKFRINQVAAFPYIVPNSVAGNICKALRLTGHNTTISFGPGAGLMGLGFSMAALKSAHAKALLSLSVDEMSERIITDLYMAGLMSSGAPLRGEGACAVMLETASYAKSRSARIVGRLCSAEYSTETGDCMQPDTTARVLEDTMKSALEKAGVGSADIGVVCCNRGNVRETEAVHAVIGKRDDCIIDVSPVLGFAEATAPLFTLAYALLDSSLRTWRDKKYILLVFSSSHGVNCAVVIQKGE